MLVDPDWVKATTRARPLLPDAPTASSWRPVLYAAGLVLAVLAGVVLARHPQVDRLVSALPGMQPAAPPDRPARPDEVAPGTGGAGEPVAAPHALEGQPGDPARGTPAGPGPDGVPALGGAGPSPAAMDGGAPARVEDSEGAAAAVGAAAPQPQEDACSQLDTWKDELPSRLNEDSRRYLARKPRARLDRPPLSELEDLLQDGRNVRATAECLAVQRRVEAWRKKNLRAR